MVNTLRKMILVVDDGRLNLKLAEDLLTLEGYQVLTASDGAAALQMLQTTVPDLILLDLTLPEMDGYDVVRKIRSQSRMQAVQVIAWSALDGTEDERRLQEAGFNGRLAKSCGRARFLELINDKVGRAES